MEYELSIGEGCKSDEIVADIKQLFFTQSAVSKVSTVYFKCFIKCYRVYRN